MRAVIVAILALALAGTTTVRADHEGSSFTLKPGDVIDVSVLEDANLNRQVLVRPDGRVTLPIVGSVEVAGRTPEQVRSIVLARLSRDFVTPPTVSVALTNLGSRNQLLEQEAIQNEFDPTGRIFIVGQVGGSGSFEFDKDKPFNILQAISLAGGPGPFAATKRIQIRRIAEDGTTQVFLFNYKDVEEGESIVAPMELMDGDVIVVPERGLFE